MPKEDKDMTAAFGRQSQRQRSCQRYFRRWFVCSFVVLLGCHSNDSNGFAFQPLLLSTTHGRIISDGTVNARESASASSQRIMLCRRRSKTGSPWTQLEATTSKIGSRLIVSAQDFAETIATTEANRPVMVFYNAPWCGPCRLSIPVVKEVRKLYSSKMDTVEVCTDDVPDVAADAGVVSIPTIQLYFRGKLLDTLVGCVAKQVLAGSVEKVLEDVASQINPKRRISNNDDEIIEEPAP